MKKVLVFCMLLLGTASCSSPNEIPDDVMGINQMKPIVWDMMRAGSLAQNLYVKDTVQQKKEAVNNYAQVFKIYGISKEEFYSSYKYYLEHPDKHKILMDSVSVYANRQRDFMFRSRAVE